jgi:hypothetical protein
MDVIGTGALSSVRVIRHAACFVSSGNRLQSSRFALLLSAFWRLGQPTVAGSKDFRFGAREHVRRGDLAEGAVQADLVVMVQAKGSFAAIQARLVIVATPLLLEHLP